MVGELQANIDPEGAQKKILKKKGKSFNIKLGSMVAISESVYIGQAILKKKIMIIII